MSSDGLEFVEVRTRSTLPLTELIHKFQTIPVVSAMYFPQLRQEKMMRTTPREARDHHDPRFITTEDEPK